MNEQLLKTLIVQIMAMGCMLCLAMRYDAEFTWIAFGCFGALLGFDIGLFKSWIHHNNGKKKKKTQD